MSGVEKQLMSQTPENIRTFSSMLIMKFTEMVKQLTRQSEHLLKVHLKFKEENLQCLLLSQDRTLNAI